MESFKTFQKFPSSNGEKIYNLTIGDFDPSVFPIPAELEALIIESYQNRNTSYPAAEAVPKLSKSLFEIHG
ncbi:MAG: hypothetical protein IBJ16_04810 [Chitinophagaceae bacterium]|nr:hypothetical protein [Chitinophagaceae bacterium]